MKCKMSEFRSIQNSAIPQHLKFRFINRLPAPSDVRMLNGSSLRRGVPMSLVTNVYVNLYMCNLRKLREKIFSNGVYGAHL